MVHFYMLYMSAEYCYRNVCIYSQLLYLFVHDVSHDVVHSCSNLCNYQSIMYVLKYIDKLTYILALSIYGTDVTGTFCNFLRSKSLMNVLFGVSLSFQEILWSFCTINFVLQITVQPTHYPLTVPSTILICRVRVKAIYQVAFHQFVEVEL